MEQTETSKKKSLREGGSCSAPRLVFIFLVAATFPVAALVLLYSHVPFHCTHPLSPHSCCCFIIPLLSFLPSMLLLSTFSSPSSLCSRIFCGKHHLLLYLPLLDSSSFLPLQPRAILPVSSPHTVPFLLPSPPSDRLPHCQMVNKAHEAKLPFLFTPHQSATTCHTSTDTRTSVRKQTQRLHSKTEPHKSVCVSVEAEYKTEQQRNRADKRGGEMWPGFPWTDGEACVLGQRERKEKVFHHL